MSHDTIKYVAAIEGAAVLDINDEASYFMSVFVPHPPKQISSWAKTPWVDGQLPGERRYHENGELECECTVVGTSDSDLDSKVNALIVQIKKRVNYIEYKPVGRTSSRWLITYWPEEYDDSSYFDVLRRQSGKEATVKWKQPIFPFYVGTEQTIEVIKELGLNNNLEDWAGGIANNWTFGGTSGSNTLTMETSAPFVYQGNASVKCTRSTSTTNPYMESTDYIMVDSTKHYQFGAYMRSGDINMGLQPRYEILCYDAANQLTGTITASPYIPWPISWWNPTIWVDIFAMLGLNIIHPASDTGESRIYPPMRFPANTVKVKRRIYPCSWSVYPQVAYIDELLFAQVEYTYCMWEGYTPPEACGVGAYTINIPPGVILGDYPAPVDIYYKSKYWQPNFLMLGQRERYDPDFAGVRKSLQGDCGYAADGPLLSFYTELTIPSNELISNGSFETYTGTGNNTDWADITETREPSELTYTLGASTSSYSGTACAYFECWSGVHDGYIDVGASLEYSPINVTPTHIYRFKNCHRTVRQGTWNNPRIETYFTFHNQNHGITNALVYTHGTNDYHDWQEQIYMVSPQNMPAGTTHVHIKTRFAATSPPLSGYHTEVQLFNALDLVSFTDVTEEAAVYNIYFPMRHRGTYYTAAQVATSATTTYDDALTMTVHPEHDTLGSFGGAPDYEETTNIGYAGSTWRNTAMLSNPYPLLTIPSGVVSENADLAYMFERIIMMVSGLFNPAVKFRNDFSAFVPVDQAVARVWDNTAQNIIIDCRSNAPGVLQSLDGTLESASSINPNNVACSPYFRASPEGMNMVFLALYNNNGSYEPRCFGEITLKYRPYYYI